MYIINIKKTKIEDIIDNKYKYIRCFLKLRENNMILCGTEKGLFALYDMNTKKYSIFQSDHRASINDLIRIDDNTFMSCSDDKTIKLWKY